MFLAVQNQEQITTCVQNENHREGAIRGVVKFSKMHRTVTEQTRPKYLRAELNRLTI